MALAIETGEKNKILREKSKPLSEINSTTRKLIKEMVKTMSAENGVGLAAPQVGQNIRLIVVRMNPGEKNEITMPMINPEIAYCSQETEWGEEGCLSLPGEWGQVERAKEIIIRFENPKNEVQTLQLELTNARIIQHEIDHLDGILFTDKAKDVYKKTHTA